MSAPHLFAIGDRVRITYDPDYGAGHVGTIIETPEGFAEVDEIQAEIIARDEGPAVSVHWVQLDEPIMNDEGAITTLLQMRSRHLEPI